MSSYQRQQHLGSGSFGDVWLCDEIFLHAPRAVKYIPLDDLENRALFLAEAQSMQEVQSASVVKVYDAGIVEADGYAYIAMEYLPRGSAEDERTAHGFLPLRRAKSLACEALRGLDHIHKKGLVHCDIKPANILVGNDGRGKLADFGLASRIASDGVALPPAAYLTHCAPEMLGDYLKATPASDIYAMGVTVYRMVNGDHLLPAVEDDELEDAIRTGIYPDRSRHQPFVPDRMKLVLAKAMALNPGDRFASAEEFRHAVESVAMRVDWGLDESRTSPVWVGNSQDRHYEVAILPPSKSSTRFGVDVKAGRQGMPLRRVSAECASGLSAKQAFQHQHRVLSRITQDDGTLPASSR